MPTGATVTISSPLVDINPLESYIISTKLARTGQANTLNSGNAAIFKEGVGLRLTLYDSSSVKLSPTGLTDTGSDGTYYHDPKINHILVASNTVPIVNETGTAAVNVEASGFSINKIIQAQDIPVQAAKAKLEAVCYNHYNGPFYWTNLSLKNIGTYYYASQDDAGAINPHDSSSWTHEFNWVPSYGSSVNFQCEVNEYKMGNGYYEVFPKNTNHISANFDLQFNNRSDREAKAIMHFLENKAGANEFNFTPPAPYNTGMLMVCESFSSSREYDGSNNVQATFIADNIDNFDWQSVATPYTGAWSASTAYEINDYVQYAGNGERNSHNSYYYSRGDSTSDDVKSSKKWTNEYFHWVPSMQQTLSQQPRITKIELGNKFAQRGEDGINPNILSLSNSYKSRSDKEAGAISHFLQHKLGYITFESLLPPNLSNRRMAQATGATIGSSDFYVSGTNTGIIELEEALALPVGTTRLENDQEIFFENIQSTHNKLFLADPYLEGETTMMVQALDYAGPIPPGSPFTIFPAISRFYCKEWSHSWNFKNNNSISAEFIESPLQQQKIFGKTGLQLTDSLNFGEVHVFESKDLSSTIYNSGLEPFNLSGVSFVDTPFNAGFSLTSDHGGRGNKYTPINFPFTIEARSEKNIYVRFAPTGLVPSGVSGRMDVFTYGNNPSTSAVEEAIFRLSLTGTAVSHFIVTGNELETECQFDIQPSGLTQIVIAETQDDDPKDYLVWKH